MEDKKWFFENDKGKEGPFTETEFIQMIENNIIGKNNLIWTFDLQNWIKLQDSVYVFYIKGEDLNEVKL